MADPNTAAPAATPQGQPARPVASQQAPASQQTPVEQSLSAQSDPNKDFDPGLKGPLNPNPVAVGAAPTKKFPARSPLITNPEPVRDENAPPEVADANLPNTLPQSTIDEMAAGRKALERNKPVAQALEEARATKPRDENGQTPAAPRA